jgi:signal transduction histidine kinase
VRSLEQTLLDRSHELEVVQAVQLAINRQLDPHNVLQMIADQARQLARCAASAVYLIEEPDSPEPVVRLAVVSGELSSQAPAGHRMPLNRTVAGLAVRDRKPYCVQDALNDPRVYAEVVRRTNMRSFLVVPLISGDRPVGVISVANKLEGPFTPEDERILTLLASSGVISLENARLYAQAGELAVLNERTRLARELHDAVTQSLFSASLIGDVLPQLWQEDPTEGLRRLEELRRLTRGALAEMRALLVELRPAALENTPLPELIRHLANAFSGRIQVPVQLQIEGRPEDLPGFQPPVKLGFYRIAQEALNNIAKHAEAEQIWLSLQAAPGGLRLEVRDDGKGFDPSARPGGHLGMEIMRERADQSGAVLEVQSQIGQGTCITLIWMPEDVDDSE